jgi:glycogen synthase
VDVGAKALRLLYAAGPGDVVGTYRWWLEGKDDPGVPDIAYSRQFLDACNRLGMAGWIVSSNTRVETTGDGAFRVENRPIPYDQSHGIRFHFGRVLYTLGLLRSALRFRADVVIAAHGVNWFLLSLFPFLGIRVIPAVHNTLWLDSVEPRRSEKILLRLARPLFASRSLAILSHPGTCERQVTALSLGRPRTVHRFIPVYRQEAFGGLPERGEARPPFRVLFVGRIEEEKGVFDLLEIARQLGREGRPDIEFDVVGTGSALDRLRKSTHEAGVAANVRCHGQLVGAPLTGMFGQSHAVIVPTKISEGFNAVVAEAVLSGRPVITSPLCPAIDLVRDAILEVPPGDVSAYKDAVVRMADDMQFYEAKRAACAALKTQFFDMDRGWGAALARALAPLIRPLAASVPPPPAHKGD